MCCSVHVCVCVYQSVRARAEPLLCANINVRITPENKWFYTDACSRPSARFTAAAAAAASAHSIVFWQMYA